MVKRLREWLKRAILSILGVNTVVLAEDVPVDIPPGPVLFINPKEVEFTPLKLIQTIESLKRMTWERDQYREIAYQSAMDLQHIWRTYNADYARRREGEVRRDLEKIA